MKPLSILLAIAYALVMAGCADPIEQRSAQEVEGQLQRGVTGQGQLGPMNRAPGDQANEHAVPQTHP
jgi:hypothetical protein